MKRRLQEILTQRFVSCQELPMQPYKGAWQEWSWLLVLWIIVTSYNIFKPYHMDDTAYLEIACWITMHPLHPMSGPLNWWGVEEPIYKINQPHLYFYVLALWGKIFGFGEPAMHALQSLASLACIVLFYRLAIMLCASAAVWVTTMLVLGPAFIVEQNLMVDVPLLAVWLVFFNLLICDARDERQTRRYGIAAIACSAAILIKYSSLVLLVILCVSLLIERRKAQAWTIVVPLSAIAAWSLFNFIDYGGIHIATRPHGSGHFRLGAMAAWVLAVGALTPLGVIAAVQWVRISSRAGNWVYLVVGAAFALLIVVVAFAVVSDLTSDRILLWVLRGNGGLIYLALLLGGIALLVRRRLWLTDVARQEAPFIYLFLWIAGTSVFYVLLAPFIAARHVLLILPAITLFLVGGWRHSLSRGSKVFGLVLTVVLSTGLCVSDWRFADFYRSEVIALKRSLPPGSTVWVSGHWGWQWYATKAGFQEVDVQASVLQPGDYLVVAEDVDYQSLARRPESLRLIRRDVQGDPWLNIFCTGRNGRFYQSTASVAPWSLSLNCINHVTIFKAGAEK